MMRDQDKLIEYGRVLIVEGLITADDIREACKVEDAIGNDIANALLLSTPLSRDDLATYLSKNCLIPKLESLDLFFFSEKLVAILPEEEALRLRVVPVALLGDILVVGSEDIFNIEPVALLRQSKGLRVKMMQLGKGMYDEAMKRTYGKQEIPVVAIVAEPTPVPEAVPPAPSQPSAPLEKVYALNMSRDEFNAMEWALNGHLIRQWEEMHTQSKPIDAIKIA